MADEVVTTSSSVTKKYKWTDCEFKWTDARAKQSWSNFAVRKHSLNVNASINISDRLNKNIKVLRKELLQLLDSVRKAVSIYRFEKLDISETYWDNILFMLNVLESAMISDNLKSCFFRSWHESFRATDAVSISLVKGALEQLNLGDRSRYGLMTAVFERTDVQDGMEFGLAKTCKDTFALGDGIYRSLGKVLKDDVIIADSFERMFIASLLLTNAVSVYDRLSSGMDKLSCEQLGFTDALSGLFSKDVYESINLQELFLRKVAYIAQLLELVNVGDGKRLELWALKTEDLVILDAFVRACHAVLGNITLKDGEIDLQEFEAIIRTAPGYSEFADFTVGDYEYEQALIRVVMQSEAVQGEPLIYGLETNIDIPDTDDRGRTIISDISKPTKVYFNKRYYHPPEVVVILVGATQGEALTVRIPNAITTEWFELEIVNTQGMRVAGVVSWTSKGY